MPMLGFDLIAPHYCCSCGQIGSSLCDNCKYDIISDVSQQCMSCLKPVGRYGDVCKECHVNYAKGWYVGLHRGALKRLIEDYKFHNVRQNGHILGDLLSDVLPEMPNDDVITTIPTIPSHIRQRGYDHAAILAKTVADSKDLRYKPLIVRKNHTTQRGANRQLRLRQAQIAFTCPGAVPRSVLVIDDVATTGASLNAAAAQLKLAGAQQVWVATITREPLD